MNWKQVIPTDIAELYEVHDYKHAAAILSVDFPSEFGEVCKAFRIFRLNEEEVKKPGDNESPIPKKFAEILRPMGWIEKSLSAKVVVDDQEVNQSTHKVDFLKGRVALDVEWNSKDQTFDRDLYAFRAFFEYDKISLGILVTRSNELDPWFKALGAYNDKHGERRRYSDKYGASTTHMGKLLPRLKAGRSGGCPVLVFGITPRLVAK